MFASSSVMSKSCLEDSGWLLPMLLPAFTARIRVRFTSAGIFASDPLVHASEDPQLSSPFCCTAYHFQGYVFLSTIAQRPQEKKPLQA